MPYYAPGYEYLLPLYGKDSFLHKTVEEAALSTGVIFNGFTVEGFIGMGCVINPTDIFTPGTPKGVNMRAPGALLAMLFPIQDLGFNAVTVPYAEVPTAIQTGVVDGWSGGTPIVNLAWLSDIINYFHVNYMHVEAPSYAASVRGLAKLPDEDRQIVLDVMQEQAERSFTMAQEYEDIALEELKDAGVEVIVHTPAQIRVLADFVRDVSWTRLEDEFGVEIVDRLREEHARYVNW
jgi:TRAP-type C4-dicarboxylate transport system substrate-binding protein